MAYAATVTRVRSRINRRAIWTITVVETGVTSATDEYTIDNVPPRGKVIEHRCKLTSGGTGITATTVDPELGTATTKKEVFENGTAAATCTNMNLTSGYSGTTLYGRSGAGGGGGNIGSTGNITTVMVIAEGAY